MKHTGLFWWIDRWRKSSAYMNMTLEEQGAYRNLLDEAHLRGGPLPNDERILAKACGDATVWLRVRAVVMARFYLLSDGWHNETMDEVYARTMALSRERSEAGRLGGIKSGEARREAKVQATSEANTPSKTPSQTNSPDPDPDPDPMKEQKIKAVPAALPPAQPVENSAKNIRIITKLAHEVLRGHNGDKPSGADLCEEIKTLCATRHIAYNATIVRKALDSAEVQRRENRA